MADRTPKAALQRLDARDQRVCVLTGYQGPRIVPQHRQTGMGGRKNKHHTSNLLWIDSLPNGLVEADPLIQLLAKVYGVKVPSWAPVELVPVFYAHEHQWYQLRGHGKTPLTSMDAHTVMCGVYGTDWFRWLAEVEGSPRAFARLKGWT